MKLLFYSNITPHFKNKRGIEMMCQSYSILLEFTSDRHRLSSPDYQILIVNDCFINPGMLPNGIKIIYGPQFIPEGEINAPYNASYEKNYVYNSLCVWNSIAQLEIYNSLVTPIVQFPYGVDIHHFNITDRVPVFDCLVYFKHRKTDILNKVLNELTLKNISYKQISYGSYNEEMYLKYLKECKFMLSVDGHESQGFALEEAMSCNVPLLVLDATTLYDESNDGVTAVYERYRPKKLAASSVPYWSEQCGIRIESFDMLSISLDLILNTYTEYNPRKFIIDTLSPKVCMKKILDYFELDKAQ